MEIIVKQDYDQMSRCAAEHIAELIRKNPIVLLVLQQAGLNWNLSRTNPYA